MARENVEDATEWGWPLGGRGQRFLERKVDGSGCSWEGTRGELREVR